MTVLVENIKSNKISETQLQVLLGYAEEDIYDQSRQATAFGLLKVTKRRTGTYQKLDKSLTDSKGLARGAVGKLFIPGV